VRSGGDAISRRSTILFAVGICATIVLGYASGVLQTLGYESQSVSFHRLRSSESGYSVGPKTVYLRRGSSFFVDYDAHVSTGALHVALYKVWAPGEEKMRLSHHVKETGGGQLVVPISESGWYRAIFGGSVLGNSPAGSGYDLSYTVRWGVR
jgi:hypothetical protein